MLVAMLLLRVRTTFAFFGLSGAGAGWGEGLTHLLCGQIASDERVPAGYVKLKNRFLKGIQQIVPIYLCNKHKLF